MDDDTRVEWRNWGAEAFAEARENDRPVLLSLTATWCADCHEMDARTYGDPGIAANLNDGFVPVRVDVDRHPRVRARYNMGGFPSTVFATPAGEVLTGAGFIGPEGMRQVLDTVRERWVDRGADAGRVPRALAGDPTPAGEVTPDIEEQLVGQLDAAYDREYAGWGDGPKFPLPRTVEFALKRRREQARRTLDAVGESLYDGVEGGFFRFAEARDWNDPHREKLLDANAGLVRAFAEGYLYTGKESFRRRASGTVGYLTDALWTGTAFGGSQGPAEGRGYYELDATERAEATPPRRDLTAYAGGTALAVDALLTLHAYTDDQRARTYAVRALEYALETLVDDGVVTHFDGDGAASGLLEDHARVVAACVRAAQVLGDDAPGDPVGAGRAVADYAVETLHEAGSFRDGPADGVGLLGRPLRPLDANVEMARSLCDLAVVADEPSYRDVAEETVAAFAGAADRFGVEVAEYGAVAARLCRPPLVLTVGDAAGSDLHRAALRVADHEKIVRPGASVLDAGTARVRVGDTTRTATTPDELVARVEELADAA